MKRMYLAGPMTHYRHFNFPAFDAVRDKMTKTYDVVSPADIDRLHGFDGMQMSPDDPCDTWPKTIGWDTMACIQRDVDAIKSCDVIYMLKGWERSTGANAELAVARWMGKEIMYEVEPKKHVEADPHGKNPHAGGAKLDSGKIKAGLLIDDFPLAIWAIAEVATFGANKYVDSGWVKVPDAIKRYGNAKVRHQLKHAIGEELDQDSKLSHLAHEAWNMLAVLELMLREKQNKTNEGK